MSNFHRPSPPVSDIHIPKWDRDVLIEGFVPFPKRLLRCLGEVFTGEDAVQKLQVILAIVDAKRLPKDGVPVRPPTLEFLAFNAGMRTHAFEQYVEQLQWDELVSVLDSDPKHFEVDLSLLLRKIQRLTPAGS